MSVFGQSIIPAFIVAVVSYMGSIALSKQFETRIIEKNRNAKAIYKEYLLSQGLTLEQIDELPYMQTTGKNDKIIETRTRMRARSSSAVSPTNDSVGNVSDITDTSVKNDNIVDRNEISRSNVNLDENESDEQTGDRELLNKEKKDESNESDSKEMEKKSDDREKKEEKIWAEKPLTMVNVTVDANREFIAYGMANLIGSFFGSLIVSGLFYIDYFIIYLIVKQKHKN